MRVSFSLSSVLYLVLALSLAIHGIEIEATSISLSLSNANTDTYTSFINEIRKQLSVGAERVYNMTVLRQSVPDSERFIFINLTNSINETITLAIDVSDVQVVAYKTMNESYFFPDAPELAFNSLFSESHQNTLNFSSSYEYIEAAAGTTRSKTPLGLTPLHSAIGNLFHHRYVPSSFLVVCQTIFEASKFRYIEQSVRNSIRDDEEFTPGQAILSLEDNWSTLSANIQGSSTLQGLFANPIKLFNSKDEVIDVDSIYYPYIIPNIALQVKRCHTGNRKDKLIKMPGNVGDDDGNNDDGVHYNDPCEVMERTTHISGRRGYCVESNDILDGKPIILQRDGTIINPNIGNGLALTAEADDSGTLLTGNPNTYISLVASIIGFKDMCLEAIACSDYSHVWMEKCVEGKKDQEWAIYSDGTIRVHSKRNLCVTAYGDGKQDDLIFILDCRGTANQQWVFKTDGSIYNPSSGLVMDVMGSDIHLHQIILYAFHDTPNQIWFPFY